MSAPPRDVPWERPALVASDMDGTLLTDDRGISPRTRAAIAAVEASGTPFVLVTGRPPRWMSIIAEQSGHMGTAVCANGAVVYDLATETVLSTILVDPALLADAVARLRHALPDATFAGEDSAVVWREPDYPIQWDQGSNAAPFTEWAHVPMVKLLVRHARLTPDELLATATRELAGLDLTLTHSSSVGALLEVSAGGVSKATGLAEQARLAGVTLEDCVAFGDMPNDIPMISEVGWGVAVANAHPSVLAVADEVCQANTEDGVARVLERWF